MEILKLGRNEYDKFKFDCNFCHSEFLADRDEWEFDEYCENATSFCPVCNKPCKTENRISYFPGAGRYNR